MAKKFPPTIGTIVTGFCERDLWLIAQRNSDQYKFRLFTFVNRFHLAEAIDRQTAILLPDATDGYVMLRGTPADADKAAEPGTTSRALAVHARTLELYRQLDLADFVVERGHKVPAVNLWVKGEPAARLPFATVGEDLTAYAFLEIFPQDQHERLLIERLEKLGVAVERRTELMRFTEEGDRVTASLRGPDGHEVDCESTYIAGCDGARLLVRETLGTGFGGGTERRPLSPEARYLCGAR
jgi:FAD binding domain